MMTDRPLLSLTLIARNEKDNVTRLLDSCWEHVDQVVVVDTGSTDGTLDRFRRYAELKSQPDKLVTGTFEWCDDFAAARQAADDLATGQWVVWADLDDTVVGLDKLRQYAQHAAPNIVAFFCHYAYAHDQDGNIISELWRERVVRHDGNRWQGRLHEHKVFGQPGGQVVRIGKDDADWIHRRDHTVRTGERNLRILEAWDADQPNDPRILQSLAMEYMGMDRHKEASDTFDRYLALGADTPDRRAQACRHMCIMLMIQGRVEEARNAALRSLADTGTWADTYLTLAEACQTLGKPDEGFLWAQMALSLGTPDTLLIINPLQYTAHPHALMAICLAQTGRYEEAVNQADMVLAIAPSYQLITDHVGSWRGALKKQRTIGAFVACADTIVETGEVLKANELLRAVPWYVADQPQLIEKRAQLGRMVVERQQTTNGKAEDPAADAFVARLREAA